jgi:hypothetical protein
VSSLAGNTLPVSDYLWPFCKYSLTEFDYKINCNIKFVEIYLNNFGPLVENPRYPSQQYTIPFTNLSTKNKNKKKNSPTRNPKQKLHLYCQTNIKYIILFIDFRQFWTLCSHNVKGHC